MSYIEKEKLIKADIASIENKVRHAFNQGYDLGYKEGKSNLVLSNISLDVYKQVAKERDIAIQQLHELGYEFGQKIEPSVTPIRPKGHWIFVEGIKGKDNVEKCSCCGSHWREAIIYRTDTQEYLRTRLLYCPNCGADMRGEEDRDDN